MSGDVSSKFQVQHWLPLGYRTSSSAPLTCHINGFQNGCQWDLTRLHLQFFVMVYDSLTWLFYLKILIISVREHYTRYTIPKSRKSQGINQEDGIVQCVACIAPSTSRPYANSRWQWHLSLIMAPVSSSSLKVSMQSFFISRIQPKIGLEVQQWTDFPQRC
jgi:hypothetical protein